MKHLKCLAIIGLSMALLISACAGHDDATVPPLQQPARPVERAHAEWVTGASIPSLSGAVTVTDPHGELLWIDLDLEDGVESGLELTVLRGEQFIAQVRVEEALGWCSRARVVLRAPDQVARAGDEVVTRIE